MASDMLLLQLMRSDVNARFDTQGVADEGRPATWRVTLRRSPSISGSARRRDFCMELPGPQRRYLHVELGITLTATLLELAADIGVPLAVTCPVFSDQG
jgi:hypothetical protein